MPYLIEILRAPSAIGAVTMWFPNDDFRILIALGFLLRRLYSHYAILILVGQGGFEPPLDGF